ncbi:melatonin-related receptor-like [Paramacrobiotus metropolitanus]|uniref:melatonin-related receptor-like n=1 Tax=Paramacrobiotus metropolitanus TaxID=2943436 RepID=UPI002445A961|nr:melatonin-related receptor-like [Paramacrobiotus metropolitanus]
MNATNDSFLLFNSTKFTSTPSTELLTLWASWYLTFCYGGAVSNSLVAGLILANVRLRAGCGLLIGHYLIAHAALCFLSYPAIGIMIYQKLMLHWDLEIRFCGILMWIHMTIRYAGNWIESYVAINRLVALCFPFQYRRFANQRLEQLMVIVLWVTAGCLACLGCFDLGVVYAKSPLGSCGILQKDGFGVLTFVVGYYGPLGVAAAAYSVIYLKLLLDRRRRKKIRQANQRNGFQKPNRKRVVKANMMFVAFLWNSVCYLVWPMTLTVSPELQRQRPLVALLLGSLQMVGYVTNPVT